MKRRVFDEVVFAEDEEKDLSKQKEVVVTEPVEWVHDKEDESEQENQEPEVIEEIKDSSTLVNDKEELAEALLNKKEEIDQATKFIKLKDEKEIIQECAKHPTVGVSGSGAPFAKDALDSYFDKFMNELQSGHFPFSLDMEYIKGYLRVYLPYKADEEFLVEGDNELAAILINPFLNTLVDPRIDYVDLLKVYGRPSFKVAMDEVIQKELRIKELDGIINNNSFFSRPTKEFKEKAQVEKDEIIAETDEMWDVFVVMAADELAYQLFLINHLALSIGEVSIEVSKKLDEEYGIKLPYSERGYSYLSKSVEELDVSDILNKYVNQEVREEQSKNVR